ncbi:hypothetical protein BJF85_16445 [Saccharomonospora sp. CUA-673]|nr:hypothetical protein BJF85_16445 [Saccharomonospora sp. CUA-673]
MAGSHSTLRQIDFGLVMISRAYAAGTGPTPSMDAPVSDIDSAVSIGMCRYTIAADSGTVTPGSLPRSRSANTSARSWSRFRDESPSRSLRAIASTRA